MQWILSFHKVSFILQQEGSYLLQPGNFQISSISNSKFISQDTRQFQISGRLPGHSIIFN